MTGPVRCLSRPDHAVWSETDVVSREPIQRESRGTLAQFVRATSMKPVHMSEGDHQKNIEDFLDTMTWAERITIEIEMQGRNAAVHSFDYDPLK